MEPGPGATQGIGDQPIVEFHDREQGRHKLHRGNAQLQVIEEELAHWEAPVILRPCLGRKCFGHLLPEALGYSAIPCSEQILVGRNGALPKVDQHRLRQILGSQGWVETLIRFLLSHVIPLPRLSLSVCFRIGLFVYASVGVIGWFAL